jgi:HEPN domain
MGLLPVSDFSILTPFQVTNSFRMDPRSLDHLNPSIIANSFGRLFCLDSNPTGNYNQITMRPAMKFDIQKTVQYWIEGAVYDIEVAEALFEKEKYPYALFMGHLALEKLLKALVVRATKNHAPHTHSLPLLAQKTGLKMPQKTVRALARFMEFHFEAR